ncbi:uncharacterized protein LOC119401999 [Rhipicephalus sanguineus]|uniref:uncharacterized protein LOC119401999 n=1 Tax=Rhipicephalus sanguineus TaxID=34632 RepID=UPI0020C59151|nr:uncharacterized protein LOC119401999 [Rhipicephalus sanguineus]
MGGRSSRPVNDGNAETTLARPQDEETGRAVQVAGSHEELGDSHAPQQAQAVDPPEIIGISHAGTVVETLERLTALHARRIRLTQRAEAVIEVHAPQDLKVLVQKPCHIKFIPVYQQAIVGSAGTAEDPQHLAEWETFARALLAVHRCISCFSLHISAVPQPRGHFYRGFSLQNGIILINIETSAFEDPWRDFVLPCLRYLYRLRNPQHTTVHYLDQSPAPPPGDITNQIYAAVTVGIGLPEFIDNRISGILDATMNMRSLRQIAIYFNNTGAGPVVQRNVWLILTHHGRSGHWRLTYEVDGGLQSLMNCESDTNPEVTTTVGIDRGVPLPRLVART